MTQDDKGGGLDVWNGLKKDDVIYEQPLILIYLAASNQLHALIDHEIF